jgi:hypothetical protein
MRVLRFIVTNSTITQDPTCNFEGLVPGAGEPIRAEFSFSPEWKSSAKVVGIWSILGHEYTPQVLKDGKSCAIPYEALNKAAFKLQVLGKCN